MIFFQETETAHLCKDEEPDNKLVVKNWIKYTTTAILLVLMGILIISGIYELDMMNYNYVGYYYIAVLILRILLVKKVRNFFYISKKIYDDHITFGLLLIFLPFMLMELFKYRKLQIVREVMER